MGIFYNIEFLQKEYFLLLLLVPFILYFFYKKQKTWYNFIFLDDLKSIFKVDSYLFYVKLLLVFLILTTSILILADPNTSNAKENIKKNGIDIVLAMDISGSMEADDLKPNRIEAAKNVINDFIWNLKTDRLGLVVFAWKPFTSIPLTFDYNILKENITNLSTKNINQNVNWLNWTAIWDAILMAKTLFKAPSLESETDYKKREKVIILLTDWDANIWVDPTLAWLSAKQEWIKIYTVWIWSENWWNIKYQVWPFTKQQIVPPLNDKTLKQIANDTSWKYFRADNNAVFSQIFNELSKLEKNDIEVNVKKEYKEYYKPFVYSLIIFLGLFVFILFYKKELLWNYKV